MRVVARWTGFLLIVACHKPEPDIEGNLPGECTDRADNDQDGYFDCDDSNCFGSPDCQGDADTDADSDSDTDSDTDADTDSDTDADTDADIGADLQNIEVTYDLHFDFDANGETLGFNDCVQHFFGAGSQSDVHGEVVTFHGTWTLQSSDCNDALNDPAPSGPVWWPSNGQAYHSINFKGSIDTIDAWIAHGGAADDTPKANPMQNNQYYIFQMNAPYDDSTKHFHYEETDIGQVDILQVTNLSVLDIEFPP